MGAYTSPQWSSLPSSEIIRNIYIVEIPSTVAPGMRRAIVDRPFEEVCSWQWLRGSSWPASSLLFFDTSVRRYPINSWRHQFQPITPESSVAPVVSTAIHTQVLLLGFVHLRHDSPVSLQAPDFSTEQSTPSPHTPSWLRWPVLHAHASIPEIPPTLCFCNQHRCGWHSRPNTSPAFACLSMQPPVTRSTGDSFQQFFHCLHFRRNPFWYF